MPRFELPKHVRDYTPPPGTPRHIRRRTNYVSAVYFVEPELAVQMTQGQLGVAGEIGHRFAEDGECCMSNEDLAIKCDTSVATVRATLVLLEGLGAIERQMIVPRKRQITVTSRTWARWLSDPIRNRQRYERTARPMAA
jgi:hypothetical protein